MASQSKNRRSGQSELGLSMAEAAMAGQAGGPMGGMSAGPMEPMSRMGTGALPPGIASMGSLPSGLANMESLPAGLANFQSRVPALPSGLGYNETRERMHGQFGDALEFLRGQREAAAQSPAPAPAPAPGPAGLPQAELQRLGMNVSPDSGNLQDFLGSSVAQKLMEHRQRYLANGGDPAGFGGWGGFGGGGRGGSMGTGPAGGGGFGNAGQGMGGGVGPGTGGVY